MSEFFGFKRLGSGPMALQEMSVLADSVRSMIHNPSIPNIDVNPIRQAA